jgi:hypothetical protein
MGHSYVPRNPRGQQRDKIYREALRLELADMSEGEELKKLRQIARVHIERAASGDMQAIKELADRLDGRPAQIPEHNGPDSADSARTLKIVRQFVHVHETREEMLAAEEPVLIEWSGVRDANGSGVLNEDTARTKR